MANIQLLDCTLRDGGYYTNWDFDSEIVEAYIKSTNVLPIDYIEIGYRNNPSKEYLGKYGYCPVFEVENIRKNSVKKLSVMINEKSTKPEDIDRLLLPIQNMVDLIRIAVDPQNLKRSILLAIKIKELGFKVGFNVMYMSKWLSIHEDFFATLSEVNDIIDLFFMVDSYGSVSPNEIKMILNRVQTEISCPIGFHGHNNLELGLINALTAVENGATFIDATVLGMGRGAGNLKLELLLTYLNKHQNLNLDFNILGELVDAFTPLFKKYNWGTNLPYMLSGINSLPQKDVMDWVNNRIYSFNSIVRALENKKSNLDDNARFPIYESTACNSVLIVGGGESAAKHIKGIEVFLEKQKSISIIHATSRHAEHYEHLPHPQYYALVGSEGKRLARTMKNKKFEGTCILPPYPRKMGTEVPSFAMGKTYEVESIQFAQQCADSCTTLALQISLAMNANEIFFVGYDGYPGGGLSEKERDLSNENVEIFKDFCRKTGKKLISLTPTLYKELETKSLYQYI